jgi:hypothetical protein
MDGKVAAVAEYYRVGVLTVAVVAYGAFGILLLSLASWLAVDSRRTARTGPMRLWRFRIRFGDTLG